MLYVLRSVCPVVGHCSSHVFLFTFSPISIMPFCLLFQTNFPSTTNAVILFHLLQLQTSSTYQEILYSSSRSDCSFVSLLIWSLEWPPRDSWIIPSTEISPDLFSCHILLALPRLVSSTSQIFIGPSSGLRCTELFLVHISLFLVCPVIYLSHPISPL